ncbi:MAG: DUF692 domain-containing protein [Bacteroidales bacterium]|nr:DUF692 domain-containing protein [Bacteroidales bacterium]
MNNYIGIGFRKEFSDEFLSSGKLKPGFIEVAPENWMGIGGYWKKIFKQVTEKYLVLAHGLSLSIGSPEDLDWTFLKQVKDFIKEYDIQIYSEHLSYSKCDNAHLYDLLPVPFTEDAIKHISNRIKHVQDFLEMKIAIENVSYYTPVAAEMTELEFINEIVSEADCNLLLDVNNVYVNAFNHKYNAIEFIHGLPLEKVSYIHMAGHEQVEPDLIIDTHGANVIELVYDLFDYTTRFVRPVPVLLERDFNIPDLEVLQDEINKLNRIISINWDLQNESTKKHIPAAV